MMLLLTLRPPRQSLLDGPSTVFWVAVVAWTVVIKPSTIPKLSLMTLANGARQLVVQEALEIYVKKFIITESEVEEWKKNSRLCVWGHRYPG